MCKKPKMPTPQRVPEVQREQSPDNGALYDQARTMAAKRGGGSGRSTMRSTMRSGYATPLAAPQLAMQGQQRLSTVLG